MPAGLDQVGGAGRRSLTLQLLSVHVVSGQAGDGVRVERASCRLREAGPPSSLDGTARLTCLVTCLGASLTPRVPAAVLLQALLLATFVGC